MTKLSTIFSRERLAQSKNAYIIESLGDGYKNEQSERSTPVIYKDIGRNLLVNNRNIKDTDDYKESMKGKKRVYQDNYYGVPFSVFDKFLSDNLDLNDGELRSLTRGYSQVTLFCCETLLILLANKVNKVSNKMGFLPVIAGVGESRLNLFRDDDGNIALKTDSYSIFLKETYNGNIYKDIPGVKVTTTAIFNLELGYFVLNEITVESSCTSNHNLIRDVIMKNIDDIILDDYLLFSARPSPTSDVIPASDNLSADNYQNSYKDKCLEHPAINLIILSMLISGAIIMAATPLGWALGVAVAAPVAATLVVAIFFVPLITARILGKGRGVIDDATTSTSSLPINSSNIGHGPPTSGANTSHSSSTSGIHFVHRAAGSSLPTPNSDSPETSATGIPTP